jgi:hypothetical protein
MRRLNIVWLIVTIFLNTCNLRAFENGTVGHEIQASSLVARSRQLYTQHTMYLLGLIVFIYGTWDRGCIDIDGLA